MSLLLMTEQDISLMMIAKRWFCVEWLYDLASYFGIFCAIVIGAIMIYAIVTDIPDDIGRIKSWIRRLFSSDDDC